jgi:hypothetical protein
VYSISNRGQTKRRVPPVWEFGEVLTINHLKIGLVTKEIHETGTWAGTTVLLKQWKWNVW